MPRPKQNISWESMQIPLSGTKPVDVSWTPITPDQVSILEEKLRDILKNLPTNTPDSFRDSAERALSLFMDLEAGKAVTDYEFLTGIQRSFIFPAKVVSKILPNPIAMPPWIDRLPPGILPLDPDQQHQASLVFDTIGERLLQQVGGKKHSPQSGAAIGQTYFVLKESDTVPGNAFKVYIEGISQLNESGLSQLFNTAIALGIAPNELKHHEGSAVLYWKNAQKNIIDQFIVLCKEGNIETRGPASDVFIVKGVREGKIDYKVISNDQVGTSVTSGFEWNAEAYSPEQFFKQWIQFCFAFGRKPDAAGFSAFLPVRIPVDAGSEYDAQIRSAYKGRLPIMFRKK